MARRDPLQTIVGNASPAVANLASLTSAVATLIPAATRGYYAIEVDIYLEVTTPEADDFILVGVTVDDITTALLEEFLELQGPEGPDKVQDVERADRGRIIKPLALVPYERGSTADFAVFLRNIKVGLRVLDGQTVYLWAYNPTAGALGASIDLNARAFFLARWEA